MIPTAYIQEWSTHAPWPDSRLIEQDLIICRALCELFNAPALAGKLAFRGRYSEDIDLVQLHAESIGSTVDAVRECLSWLGNCSRDRGEHSTHLMFRFAPEAAPDTKLKLKIEINTREHENLLGIRKYPFVVDSGWYQGKTDIVSFQPEELFGTKLRALLQRRKNRDLFDLNEGLSQLGMDTGKLVSCFEHYLKLEGKAITRWRRTSSRYYLWAFASAQTRR